MDIDRVSYVAAAAHVAALVAGVAMHVRAAGNHAGAARADPMMNQQLADGGGALLKGNCIRGSEKHSISAVIDFRIPQLVDATGGARPRHRFESDVHFASRLWSVDAVQSNSIGGNPRVAGVIVVVVVVFLHKAAEELGLIRKGVGVGQIVAHCSGSKQALGRLCRSLFLPYNNRFLEAQQVVGDTGGGGFCRQDFQKIQMCV